jgi:hypothetical protein
MRTDCLTWRPSNLRRFKAQPAATVSWKSRDSGLRVEKELFEHELLTDQTPFPRSVVQERQLGPYCPVSRPITLNAQEYSLPLLGHGQGWRKVGTERNRLWATKALPPQDTGDGANSAMHPLVGSQLQHTDSSGTGRELDLASSHPHRIVQARERAPDRGRLP